MSEKPMSTTPAVEQGSTTPEAWPARRWTRFVPAILVLVVVLAASTAGGIWLAKYDPPIERTVASEWMTDLTDERVAELVNPADGSRWLDFPGVVNGRDIGGYPTYDGRTTRWGVLFRSGRLRDLTDHGCEVFRSLSIDTVIDLRNRMVVDTHLHDGDPICVQKAANMELFRFIPPRKKGETKAEAIRKLVSRNTHTIKNVFETLADERRLPLLFHCTQGRDRAGIITYLLLDMLGVDRRVIRAEYDLSGDVGKTSSYEGINAIFDDVDAAGSIHQYLHDYMEISYKTQRRVRENLLD
jgi:protein-tyrosine phosphatase